MIIFLLFTYSLTLLVDKCRYNPRDDIYKAASSQMADNADIPFEVNWRSMDAVGDVRDQMDCASSWAFVAVSAIESHASIQSGEPIRSFSVQHILDCMSDNNKMVCGEGSPSKAFNFIQKQGGLAMDSLYPRKSLSKKKLDETSICKYFGAISGIQVNGGAKDIKPYDEEALIQALLYQGPVTVMIDGRGLPSYKGGIWDGSFTNTEGNVIQCSSNPEDLSHVVLIVGVEYDENTQQQYYTIMNSKGTQWGENGYFRLIKKKNICGISLCASYPKLTPF